MAATQFSSILFLLIIYGASAISLSGTITSSLANGRFTILDATCGSIVILSDERTIFRASGHMLASPNYATVNVVSADCTAARTTPASLIALTATAPGSLVEISMAGLAGGEIVELRIKDISVKSWTLSTAGTWQVGTYQHTSTVSINDIKVAFVNDGANTNGVSRDVLVDYVKLKGVTYLTRAADTYMTGYWSSTERLCKAGYFQSNKLDCNGYFQFKKATPAPSTTAPTPTPTTPKPTTAAPAPSTPSITSRGSFVERAAMRTYALTGMQLGTTGTLNLSVVFLFFCLRL